MTFRVMRLTCDNNPVMNVDPSGHWIVRAIAAVIGAAAFGGIAYLIGKAMGLRGRNLAALTAELAAIGCILGVIMGPRVLNAVNQFLKPVIYFFRSRLCYLGVRL